MRLHVAALAAGRVELTGEPFHHLAHVLRARRGDRVVLFDGAGREADAVVDAVAADAALLTAGPPRAAAGATVELTLLVGLLKGEKMDWVVQKATELGVTRIVPLAAAHAVVRLDGARRASRIARWEKIAREAARQSGRADVPAVAAVTPPATAFVDTHSPLRLLFHERDAAPVAPHLGPYPAAALAVGPEGGFAPDEVAAARAAGWQVVSLGPRILRAETAALAALAIVGHALRR
jgi:16S rRNA (uracil1498-N3)-methyltransferase